MGSFSGLPPKASEYSQRNLPAEGRKRTWYDLAIKHRFWDKTILTAFLGFVHQPKF
jgi:hypothetical protein